MPSAVARSAVTPSTRSLPPAPARVRSSVTAAVNRSSPRAHTVTEQPSATSAAALASPSPRLEPVTTATFLASSRFMRWQEVLLAFPSAILQFCNPAISSTASSRQVVETPVEWNVFHLELVLLQEVLLGKQQAGMDERDHRALD